MSTAAQRLSRLLAAGMGVLLATGVAACSSGGSPSAQGTGTHPSVAGSASGSAGSAASPSPSPSPSKVTMLGTQWTQAWTDTFNGSAGSALNTASWKYDTGKGVYGTGEIENNTDAEANVHLDGQGNLEIVPLKDGSSWTSGRVQTTQQFAAPNGGEMMISASIEQPNPASGVGYWPGFWLLAPGQWPEHGEFDIMEDVNAVKQLSGTMHCGNTVDKNSDGTTGPCHEGTGLTSGLRPCPDCQTSFHTYSLVIDRRHPGAESVSWYIDGTQYFTVSESQVGTAAWTEATNHGFSIILDVALGGGFPNVRCQCTSPLSTTSPGAAMSVASVSVYTN